MMHVLCLSNSRTQRTVTVHVDGPRSAQLARTASLYVAAMNENDADYIGDVWREAAHDPQLLELLFEIDHGLVDVDGALEDLEAFSERWGVNS